MLNDLGSIAAICQMVLLQNVKFFWCFSCYLQYFNKNFLLLKMIDDETFKVMLTENVVSFEQLSPGVPLCRYVSNEVLGLIYRGSYMSAHVLLNHLTSWENDNVRGFGPV